MASDDTKVISDTTYSVPTFNWVNKKWVEASPASVRAFAKTTAARHRHKVEPLSATPFSIVATKENSTVVTAFAYNGLVGKMGPVKSLVGFPGSSITTHLDQSSDGSLELARARSKVSDYNFGETIAEFTDTTRLIAKNYKRILGFLGDLQAGRWNKLPSVPKSIRKLPSSRRFSDGYLELQFGWLPFFNDIYSAVDAYSQGLYERGASVVRRSGGRSKTITADPRNTTFQEPGSPIEASASFRGIVKSPVQAELSRLGLANPLLTAWNLVPFSFVADWFLPIAPILGSLTANSGLVSITQTVTTRARSTRTLVNSNAGAWILDQTYSASRHPTLGMIPAISLLGGISSLGKLATSAALVRSVMIGGKR